MVNKEIVLEKINLVVDKLMNLGGADYDSDKSTSKEAHKTGVIARDFGIEEFDWPQGVGLYGLEKLQTYYQDNRYDSFLTKWYRNNIDRGLPSKNINTTAPYLTLLGLVERTGNKEYETMCLERAKWLMEELPKTKEGGFQHVTSAIGDRNGIALNESEMWIDTIFMAVLFLNRMGHRYQNQAWISEAEKQILIHIKYIYEKKNGLFYHGWSFQRNDNYGGIFWSRGNSWFTLGMIDFLEASSNQIDQGLYEYLIDTYKAHAKTLKELQAPSGLWHTVLNEEDSYEEVSGSSAMAAGIRKAVRLGILGQEYLPVAEKAVEAICANIDTDGTVLNVSAGTGIGEDSEHYKKIIKAPMAYGQSLALIALCESLF